MRLSNVKEVFFMKHIRKAFALLIILLLVISLAACGDSAVNDSADTDSLKKQTEVKADSGEVSDKD